MTSSLRYFSAKTVAIIGAGPAGISAAKYVNMEQGHAKQIIDS
jgi:thioredoxin reductase